MTIAGNTNNRGNAAWRQLAAPHEQNGGCRGFKQRSRESEELETQLRRLLASCTAKDVSGVWLNWVRPTREPIFLAAPHAETDDAA